MAEAEGICSILGPGGSFRNLLLRNQLNLLTHRQLAFKNFNLINFFF